MYKPQSVTRTLLAALLATAAAFASFSAQATALITSISAPQAWNWPGATIGYEFTVARNINVTSLGVWDQFANGLTENHKVGIFTTSGQLLASTTVTNNSLLLDSFRYESINPFALDAGTYILGAYMPSSGDQGAALASITTAADITYGRNLFLYGQGFVMPTHEWLGFNAGNIGPNMLFDTTQVPEPASIALLGLGLAGLMLSRKRQNRSA